MLRRGRHVAPVLVVESARYVIEQVIANFKTWRIMHTDYRRPLATFPETISAVVALGYGARTGSPGKGYETRLPT